MLKCTALWIMLFDMQAQAIAEAQVISLSEGRRLSHEMAGQADRRGRRSGKGGREGRGKVRR